MKRGHIIVVHSDAGMREAMAAYLESNGYGRPQRYVTGFSGPDSAHSFYSAISRGRSFYPALIVAEHDAPLEPLGKLAGPLRPVGENMETGMDLLEAVRFGIDRGSGDSRTPVVLIGDNFTLGEPAEGYARTLGARVGAPVTINMPWVLDGLGEACEYYLHHKRDAA